MRGTIARHERFVGVDVSEDSIESFLKEARESIEGFAAAERRKFARDGRRWHVTVALFNELKKWPELRSLIGREVEFSFVGIGEVAREAHRAWFIVAESPELSELLATAGAPPRDFHVTIGFTEADIHGVRKDSSTLLNGGAHEA